MNIDRYNAVIDHIEKHPKEWNQRKWCGTACCIAGHAMNLFGTHAERNSCFWMKEGRSILGLSDSEAWWMFDGGRTLDDFRRLRLVHARFRLEDAAGP